MTPFATVGHMRESRARWGRIAAGVAALTVMATVAGCSAADGGASTTRTETVTVSAGGGSPAGSPGVTPGTGVSDSSGAPITVVDPNAVTTGAGPGAASSPAGVPGTEQQPSATGSSAAQGTDDSSGASPGLTASTSAVPTVDTAETRAAARMVAAQCPTVLSPRDIAGGLGRSLPAQTIRVEDVANPDNKMTARTKCYYGTADIGASRPLVVAVAGFADADAAARQRDVTLASEKAAGAKVSNSDIGVGDGEIKIMVRDGGLAVTQVGAATVSVAIDPGVVTPSALRSALTLLTRDVISHVQ